QTQFMPSSFMRYAVDFDGDGHKDIWNDVPDALASTANFLKGHGWLAGQPWGFEVALPKGLALAGTGRSIFQPFTAWKRQGVGRADGKPLPAQGEAALYLPAGIRGPALLITRNFSVIKSYTSPTAMCWPPAISAIASLAGQRFALPGRAATSSSRMP